MVFQEGGPIGLIENGDMINIDVQNRRIDLQLTDEELESRKRKWTAPAYKANCGVLYKVIYPILPTTPYLFNLTSFIKRNTLI